MYRWWEIGIWQELYRQAIEEQQIFGAIALVFAGVLMFTMNRNEWIVCLSIAAILELYTAFRIPQELDKENK